MVNRAIEEAEVHLQLIDIVGRRGVVAAASFATHAVLMADVSAVPEHGGILDVNAGPGLGLKDLPSLFELLALFSHMHGFLIAATTRAAVVSYPGMGLEDGIVHIHHVHIEVGRGWLQQSCISGNCKGGKSHDDIWGIIRRRVGRRQPSRMFNPSVKTA